MLDLRSFDAEIDKSLEYSYKQIEQKSKALANSLRRCFESARASGRYIIAYQAGLEQKWLDLTEEEILQKLIQSFEEEDFMSFREFVRLLRACSLHIGGRTSEQIKIAYNKTFKTERVLFAYKQGLREESQ